jgi:hypothetical protein
LKAIKKNHRKEANEQYSDQRLLVIVFDSTERKNKILESIGIEQNIKYLSESVFTNILKGNNGKS